MESNKGRTGNLEARLTELDLSDQSRVRDSLGWQLKERLASNPPAENTPIPETRRWNMMRRPLPAFVLGILVALVFLAVAHPEGRAALSRVGKFFQLGDNTVFHQQEDFNEAVMDSILASSAKEIEKGEMYFLHNVYGGFGGPVPEGADPYIKQVGSLSLTIEMMEFPLMVPTYFHEGIPPSFRFTKAEVMPNASVILYFGIGPFETMLMQTQVGEGASIGFSQSESTKGPDGQRVTTGIVPDMEELNINGMKVTWLIHDENRRRSLGGWAEKKTETTIGKFIWEHEGISYLLDGKFLSLEEGKKIIESLKPVTGGR